MSSATPRILVLTPYLPYPTWGFGTRVYQLCRHLSRRHEVTILSYARDEEAPEVECLRKVFDRLEVVRQSARAGFSRRGTLRRRAQQLHAVLSPLPFHGRELTTRAMQEALDRAVDRDRPDLILVESSPMCGLRFPAGIPVVVDEHNVESQLLDRMRRGESSVLRRVYNRGEHRKYHRFEDRVWSSVTACLATSPQDAAVISARARNTRTVVVPNGVDPDYFAPEDVPVTPDSLVFTGLLSYRPNLDAVRYFVDSVLPRVLDVRPRTVLTVVGGGRPEDLDSIRRPGVTVTGWVPDVRPHLSAAAAIVVPVRMGSGTRLKVLEALAAEKAVVSTSVGCEGIDVRDGENILVGDTPDEFAAAVCRLLEDADLRGRLGRAGRRLVAENYSWHRSGELVEGLYHELTGPPPRTPLDRRSPAGAVEDR